MFPKKISKELSIRIDNELKTKLLTTKKRRAIYMLKKIGYDTSQVNFKILKYRLLLKAYQVRYYNKNISGILDPNTYQLIKNHYQIVKKS